MSKYTDFRDWVDAKDGDVRQWLYDLKHPARTMFVTGVVLLILLLLTLARCSA